MAAKKKKATRVRPVNFWKTLEPIYLLALVNAIVCWSLCWLFWDRFEFSATLLGLGCFPIVVAVCAYLYLLTQKADRT